METIEQSIERIVGYKSYTNAKKADALIELDSTMIFPNLGTDSTKKEKEQAKKNSRKIYMAIKN